MAVQLICNMTSVCRGQQQSASADCWFPLYCCRLPRGLGTVCRRESDVRLIGSFAQLGEHPAHNRMVQGSIPWGFTYAHMEKMEVLTALSQRGSRVQIPLWALRTVGKEILYYEAKTREISQIHFPSVAKRNGSGLLTRIS